MLFGWWDADRDHVVHCSKIFKLLANIASDKAGAICTLPHAKSACRSCVNTECGTATSDSDE